MRRTCQLFAVIACGLLVGAGEGDLKSPAALTAKHKYEDALAKAEANFDTQRKAAKDNYLIDLGAALKQAMKDQNLDEAVKIKAEATVVKAADAPSKQDKASLESRTAKGFVATVADFG